jgi:hypothetical protein
MDFGQVLRWRFFLLGLAVLSASGCRSRPEWLRSEQPSQYKETEYFLAVGLGCSLNQAKKNAKEELTKQLKNRLADEFQSRSLKTNQFRFILFSPSRIPVIVGRPPGLLVVDTWSDPGRQQHAALAVLDRRELVASIHEQVKAHQQQCRQLVDNYLGTREKTPYPALLNLLAALELQSQVEEQIAYLASVDDSHKAQQKGPQISALLTLFDQAVKSVHLYPARGNGLTLKANEKSTVLVLGIDAESDKKRLPYSSLPVRFDLPGSSHFLISRIDPAGMAQTSLFGLTTYADKTITIRARIDAVQVIQEAGIEPNDVRFVPVVLALGRPSAEFKLTINDNDAGRIALIIVETRQGNYHKNSRLVAELKQSLTNIGYNVLGPSDMNIQLPVTPTPMNLARSVLGQADILIYGVAQAQLAKSISKTFVFAQAVGEFIAVRVLDGHVLGRIRPLSKAPGRDLKSAEERALKALSQRILRSFSTVIAEQINSR